MRFKPEFDSLTRIQLLQRWVLVQSFIYYILNDNIVSDSDYDENVRQLFDLRESFPNEWQRSSYRLYFRNFEPGCTSGFELIDKVRKTDQELYRHLHVDAVLALNMKMKRSK